MPFLRVLRDKRGYETTYLMHLFRDGNRQRSRVLYVFRTPGGIRVGRSPLERDVLRAIERQHPEIQFDWSAVRENQQIIEPPPEYRRRRTPRRDTAEEAPEADSAPVPAETAPAAASQPAVPRASVPSALEGATPDEQIAFLERSYSAIRERVLQRTGDPSRQEALLALVERLNPAAWTDADQMAAGLEGAAVALERLSRVLSRRRRRGRKRVPSESQDAAVTDGEAEPGAADADE